VRSPAATIARDGVDLVRRPGHVLEHDDVLACSRLWIRGLYGSDRQRHAWQRRMPRFSGAGLTSSARAVAFYISPLGMRAGRMIDSRPR